MEFDILLAVNPLSDLLFDPLFGLLSDLLSNLLLVIHPIELF